MVAQLQKLFMETWERQKGEPLAPRNYFPPLRAQGKEVVRAIGSAPDEPFSQIYVTLISAINSAESEILLTNAYFVPDPQLLQALIGAVGARRRRQADPAEHDRLVARLPRRPLALRAAAARRRQALRAADALLHAKTAVIDGVWATVGSTNLDWRSFLHNQELNAVILGAGLRREDARGVRARPRRVGPDHARGLAAPPDHDPRQGNVRSTLGVLAVSILPSSRRAARRLPRPRSPVASSRPLAALGAGRGDPARTPRRAAGQVRQQPVRPAAGARIDPDLGRPEGRRLRDRRPSVRDRRSRRCSRPTTGATS